MKKKVKVRAHERDGVVVDAHERVVDAAGVETLAKKIKNEKNNKDKSNTLFSFAEDEDNEK